MKRLRWLGATALALAMGVPATASAATISVDDDGLDCPSAPYTSVQAAVDAASPGDIIAICPGLYEEGPATVPAGGANAVSIAKMLTIRGAGASKVTIKPKPALASLLGTTTNYRNNFGAVIGVYRSGVRQIVDISGVTVEGGVTTVGSAVKFYNAEGSLTGSVIRNVAPLTGPQGYGVVVASNLVADRFPVRIAGNVISGYAKAGVVLDSTQAAPALGILAIAVNANTITGAGPQAQTGQQGVFATGLVSNLGTGNNAGIIGNVIADNLGTGDAASAAVRLVDLDLTPTTVGGTTTKLTATGNNLTNNGYGVRNENGAGADQTVAFTATGNWWGHVAGPSIGLPRTVGDPVNGTAVNYTGFRTTPITAPTTPTTVNDFAPTGEIDPPGPVQPGTAYTLRALAADDFGVKSVAFAIGGTTIGTDTIAPYSVAWTPGAALDGQTVTLTVTITDSSGQTAAVAPLEVLVKTPAQEPTPTPTPTATPTPEPFVPAATPTPTPEPIKTPAATAPTAVTLKAKTSKGRKLTLSGALALPAGTTCPAGATVRLTIALPGADKRVTAKLGTGCAYSVTVKLPARAAGRKATVKVTYAKLGAQRKLSVKR